jgi:hypothetical protein
MFKRFVLLALASASLAAAAADDGKVKSLLRQADAYRLAMESGRV